jgi:DNA-directed RNA polymerase specialized sigma24 family protein
MNPLDSPAPETDRPIAGRLLEDYGRGGEAGRTLRAQLAGYFPECPDETIEDAVQTACDRFLDKADGITDPDAVYVWLRTTARREVLRELDRQGRAFALDPTAGVIAAEVDERPGPAEELIGLEDTAELEVLVREVASSLSEERRRIFSLWAVGQRRPEIAAELGLSERSVKRGLLEIMREAREVLATRAGGGCEEGEPLVLRLACGLAETAEAVRARAHLDRCGRCSAFAEQLDEWQRKAGALLPPVAAEVASPGVVGRVVGRVGDTISSVRRHVLDGGAQIKQQAAVTGYTRTTADPTPLTGIRPGAVAAVVAGCLAIGTGATYCAQQGVDPLGAAENLIAGTQPEPKEEEPASPTARQEPPAVAAETPAYTPTYETAEEAPATEEPSTTHEESGSSSNATRREPEPEPEPAEVTPPAEQQFEAASPDYPATESSSSTSGSSSSESTAAETSEASRPAPVPANEAPQFGGP